MNEWKVRQSGSGIKRISCLAVIIVAACAPELRTRDWSTYRGPGAHYFRQTELTVPDDPDPSEAWNRGAAAINDAAVIGLVEPLSRVYRAIMPKPAREAITRAGQNILFPRLALANLFRGRVNDAWIETKRFAVNTTIGILGLFDPATSRGLPSTGQDFGLTFAAWGWKPSSHFVVPLYGPSTKRDACGLVPDTLTDPTFYIYWIPFRPLFSFNDMSDSLSGYRDFVHANYDPYDSVRLVSTLDRELRVTPEVFARATDDTPATQTLEAVNINCVDPEFPLAMRRRAVRIASTGRKLPYSFRMQPGSAPIVFILPGLAGHRESRPTVALAEMVYRGGYSVATISSAFNWEFMEQASTVALPGHAPIDAHDMHVALDAVYRDLSRLYPGRIGEKALMGYSMGGFHAFYIAAADHADHNELIDFDRYVALSPPVSLFHGIRELDAFYNAPLELADGEREGRMRDIMRKAVDWFGNEHRSDAGIPFTDLEARFIIGLGYRLSLREIIYASQQRQDLGILLTRRDWFHRRPAYTEIMEYSFIEYFYGFVLPYYSANDRASFVADEVVALNDLRSLYDRLPAPGRIHVLASENDFLLTESDVTWLIKTLGRENVTLYPKGGHFGAMTGSDMQSDVLESLAGMHDASTQPPGN